MMERASRPPLIAHIIYRLDVGGLENGLVNLINRIPSRRFEHLIICLDDYSEAFRQRIERDVPLYALHKRAGQDWRMLLRLWRLLRRLRPAIVHTRNLSTLECQLPAWMAGVRCLVHGEHGRDVHDLDNTSRKYLAIRKVFRVIVGRYIALSRDLERYLLEDVGARPGRVATICNGVDSRRFNPARQGEDPRRVLPKGFADTGHLVVGTVGRLEPVKDQLTLVQAFIQLLQREDPRAERYRLVIVGDGSQRARISSTISEAGLEHCVWMPGSRNDIPQCLRALDVFVLPSLGEGISNTILEAMASGLPIVATDVGGNAELVDEGINGYLVPRSDPRSLAERIARYGCNEALRREHAIQSRRRAEVEFSIDRMVERYMEVYDGLLHETMS